jgi:Ser/Thr protein kinase RdoA (MazF antagonist)
MIRALDLNGLKRDAKDMKSFRQAGRATQRKRLGHLGEVALRRYGIEDARLRFISDTANIIFHVDAAGQQYTLRIDPAPATYHLWTMLEAEMLWLSALQHDTALAVPEPVVARDGTLVQTVLADGAPDPQLVTLFRWMPGRLIGDCATPDILAQVGAFMAQLHRHTEQFALPDGITRPCTAWDKLTYWQDREGVWCISVGVQPRSEVWPAES